MRGAATRGARRTLRDRVHGPAIEALLQAACHQGRLHSTGPQLCAGAGCRWPEQASNKGALSVRIRARLPACQVWTCMRCHTAHTASAPRFGRHVVCMFTRESRGNVQGRCLPAALRAVTWVSWPLCRCVHGAKSLSAHAHRTFTALPSLLLGVYCRRAALVLGFGNVPAHVYAEAACEPMHNSAATLVVVGYAWHGRGNQLHKGWLVGWFAFGPKDQSNRSHSLLLGQGLFLGLRP